MVDIKRQAKEAFKTLWSRSFAAGQRLGVNILPNHFYSSVPDIADLKGRTDWRAPLSMAGVAGSNSAQQIAALEGICKGLDLPHDIHAKAASENGEGSGYGVIEADFLYAFIVRNKPEHVIQIGCGVSTAIILRAGKAAGYSPRITCIEPYPTPYLQSLAQSGTITLRREGAQVTPLEEVEALKKGDLFFVDSTHTVKIGSEVNRIILEMMPRLAPGVWVHFHDITFPYDHPRDVFGNLFHNSESTLLHAFLIGNSRFRIHLSLSMLHYAEPVRLRAALPNYVPQGNDGGLTTGAGSHFPSATWLLASDSS